MIINHFPNSSFEDRLNAYLRIYEIVVIGGRYYERENKSEHGNNAKDNKEQEEGQC
jgi:hypothetical protein